MIRLKKTQKLLKFKSLNVINEKICKKNQRFGSLRSHVFPGAGAEALNFPKLRALFLFYYYFKSFF